MRRALASRCPPHRTEQRQRPALSPPSGRPHPISSFFQVLLPAALFDSEQFRFVPRTCPSFGGRLSVLHCDPNEYPTMSEQAAEERRGWASDIVWVVLYSMVVLLIMV